MGRRLSGVILVVCCACAAAAPTPKEAAPTPAPVAVQAPAAAPEEAVPAMRLPADVKPTHYTLEMKIAPDQPEFGGSVDIAVALSKARQVIWLHGQDLKVTESTVKVGAETLPAKFEQVNDDGVVKLSLPKAIGPGEATLHFAWTRPYDPRLLGLYLAHESGANYAYTQFEDIFARKAYPGFDEPGFKTPFDVSLVVPADDVAVANTLPVGPEEPAGAGWKRIHYAQTKPLPTYLLAWAVGPFDVLEGKTLAPNDIRSWPVPVRGIAPKGRGPEMAFALQTGSELLLLEEQYFGIAYPYPKLDQVAVPDYAYGAMENAGEIHYREDLLLFKEGTNSEEARIQVAQVMAHEEAHQWFGDYVTMGWWEEAWLNESFATWMGTRTVEEWRPSMHSAIDFQKSVSNAMGNDALVTARAIRQPLTSVKNIGDQFDGLTYQKGGGVLAMFERFAGVEKFRKGVSEYIGSHAFASGSTDELLASISKAAGQELTAPFHTFLDQAGVPLVQASVSCADKPVIQLEQSRYFPLGSDGKQDRLWQVPVCARYSVDGKTNVSCTLLSQAQGSIELPGCPQWVLPNAEGAGYYRWSMSAGDLKKLRTAGYSHLSVRERIALAETLRTAVFAGTLPISDALEALAPIARDPEGEVAVEAIPLIEFARDRVLPDSERARVDAYAIKLFTPAFQRLGFKPKKDESTSARRLRLEVLELLAKSNSPAVVKEAVKLGRAYAGLEDGKFHPDVVDPDLAGFVLGVAVEHGDKAFFDAMLERLGALDDGALRGRVLSALGKARDPERSARALALSLEPKLRKQEGIIEVLEQSRDHRTRDASWRFVQANFDTLVQKIPDNRAAFLPYVANAFCDPSHADEAKAFFGPRAEKNNGMPKNLRQVVEYIRLCAAQADAQRASAEKFFSVPPKPKKAS